MPCPDRCQGCSSRSRNLLSGESPVQSGFASTVFKLRRLGLSKLLVQHRVVGGLFWPGLAWLWRKGTRARCYACIGAKCRLGPDCSARRSTHHGLGFVEMVRAPKRITAPATKDMVPANAYDAGWLTVNNSPTTTFEMNNPALLAAVR